MSQSQANFLPGELSVDAVILTNPEGESINLLPITGRIDIFEAIDEPFLHGRITVVDALGIADDYKIFGQESLSIRYRVKEDKDKFSKFIEKTFRTYKITNVNNTDFNTYSYAIHFIDPKFFICENSRISKTLRGSYSEMLLQTLSKDARFEKLPNKIGVDFWDKSVPEKHQLICPNWSLNELIEYIVSNANHATDSVFKNSMFFFQTMIGGFRFMSLDKMLSGDNELISRFDYQPRNINLNQEDIPTEADGGQSARILDFEIQTKTDTLRGTTRGAYSSVLKTYDPIRKVEKEIYFDLAENYKKNKDKHLSGFPPIRLDDDEVVFDGEPGVGSLSNIEGKEREVDYAPNKNYLRGAKTHYKVNHTNAFSDEAKLVDGSGKVNIQQFVGNEFLDDAILEREAMLELLSQNVLKMTIPYRQDLAVGTIINASLPIGKQGGSQSPLNDNRYLVTKIRHIVQPLDYKGTMVIQCVKESFAADIKEVKALDDYEGPDLDG